MTESWTKSFAINAPQSVLGAFLVISTALAQSVGNVSGTPVSLNVLVTDGSNRSVLDLNRDDFIVLEDGKHQVLGFFETREIPVSFGLIIDNTGSMRGKLKEITGLATSIVGSIKPEDKVFITRMANSEVRTVVDLSSDKAAMLKALASMNDAWGRTSLIDTIHDSSEYLANHEVNDLPNRRRAIVIISDGIDSSSEKDMEALVKRLHATNIQVFAIGLLPSPHDFAGGAAMGKAELRRGISILDTITHETGGRSFYPESEPQLRAVGIVVGNYLRRQYVIGYTSTNEPKKDSFRKVRIKLTPRPNLDKLTVTARLRYVTSAK